MEEVKERNPLIRGKERFTYLFKQASNMTYRRFHLVDLHANDEENIVLR